MALTPVRHTHTGQRPRELNTPLQLLEHRRLNFMKISCCSKTIQEIQLNPNPFRFQPNYILMQVTRS